MTWNYRVIVRDGEFAIHEVYYDDAGNIEAFTDEPVYPAGESVEELHKDVEYYQHALRQPVLDYHELSKQVSDSPAIQKVLKAAKEEGTIPWEQVKAELDL